MARADALTVNGIEDAIERDCQYREFGADLIFIEAIKTMEDMQRINREIDAPTLANIIAGGVTPEIHPKKLGSLGFNAVTYSTTVTYAVAKSVTRVMKELFQTGSPAGVRDFMSSFDEFNEFIGLSSLRALDKSYTEHFTNGVA